MITALAPASAGPAERRRKSGAEEFNAPSSLPPHHHLPTPTSTRHIPAALTSLTGRAELVERGTSTPKNPPLYKVKFGRKAVAESRPA